MGAGGFSPRNTGLTEIGALAPENVTALAPETESWSADIVETSNIRYRPVTIVNASAPKQLNLRIEVPVEDMAKLGAQEEIPIGPASQAPEKKLKGTRPHMIKTGKCGVELFGNILVNTKVSTPIITMGFSSDQNTPSDIFR